MEMCMNTWLYKCLKKAEKQKLNLKNENLKKLTKKIKNKEKNINIECKKFMRFKEEKKK